MKIHRIDHIGIIVDDLAAAKDVFLHTEFVAKGSEIYHGNLLEDAKEHH
jgi:hypothetical protein